MATHSLTNLISMQASSSDSHLLDQDSRYVPVLGVVATRIMTPQPNHTDFDTDYPVELIVLS